MRKNKIQLRVQPIYSIIIYYVLCLISLFLMFLPKLFTLEENGVIIKVIWCLIMTSIFLYGFVQGTLHIQFAEIDNEKIIIKNLFQDIALIKWSEISSIRREKILTYDSRGYICFEWIVIRTKENQECHRARYNKKNTYPILIIANKKNFKILNRYIKVELKNHTNA